MASVEEIRNAQCAKGPSTILAIGTATLENCVYQSDYADYYFRVTKSEQLTELKKKFNRIYLVENNTEARVLVVGSEIIVITFRGPFETTLDSLVGQALFSNGFAAVIVGSDLGILIE
ncbi:stilbene synthase 3-like [Vitis riparia]|uniref:stilbene synthase 3-like n=1 Tax=Vitis riparia TaxID=96939 RepID=UPI00155A857C|nr:stilbene synthase 3-like [Vitis riparia]